MRVDTRVEERLRNVSSLVQSIHKPFAHYLREFSLERNANLFAE